MIKRCENTKVEELLVEAVLAGKKPIHAIYTYLASIRYHFGKDPLDMDKNELVTCTQDHYRQLLTTTKERTLAKNIGQRAFPILTMLAETGVTDPLVVIELGASAGMIGRALMANDRFLQLLEKHHRHSDGFTNYITQHPMHRHPFDIRSYLGIDLVIPDAEWILACIEEPEKRMAALAFADDFPPSSNESLVAANALGFSDLPQVIEIIQKPVRPVVLTSMIMYQLPDDLKAKLAGEIESFLIEHNGLYVFMDFDSGRKRFIGGLQGYGTNNEQVGPLLFTDGDCMEWTYE